MTTPFAELAEYQATALELAGDLDLEQWLELCSAIGAMARGHQWWVGDLEVYGEEHFGHEHAQGEDLIGLEPQTLANYRYVAASVKPNRRREELSWSHHAEVARLAAGDQRKLLTAAVREHWTVRELRAHVALEYPREGTDQQRLPIGETEEVDVNKRLEEIERRWIDADQSDGYGHRRRITTDDVDDVRWLLNLAKRFVR